MKKPIVILTLSCGTNATKARDIAPFYKGIEGVILVTSNETSI